MAKSGNTITLPNAKAPSVATSNVAALINANAQAPTSEEIEKAKAEKRNTEALAAFDQSPLAAAMYRSKVDAIGAEGKRQSVESQTNATRMVELVAALFVSVEWCTQPIHSLIGPYIEAKYGEDSRNKYRVALAARCKALGLKGLPTVSAAEGNKDKGKSPKRKYAKAARAFDNAITAVTEFYQTLTPEAPSLKHWTDVMAALRSVQVQMHADAENEKLKKSA